jgi:alpha-acetolactate decarboxylase
VLATLLVLVVGACAAPRWDGATQRWGTLRSVMRDGDKSGKVEIAAAIEADSVGLGALAELAGEVIVLDGVGWIGRGRERACERTGAGDRAAFLVLARVPAWSEFDLPADTELAAFDPRVYGSFDAPTIPFVIEGELEALEAHVLQGRCPYDAADTSGAEPIRHREALVRGTLVGYWSSEPPGVVAHHDTPLHVHVLVPPDRERAGYVGHVDTVRVRAGARLRVPR